MSVKQPKVDLVQVFCANFESRQDFSGPKPRLRKPLVEWPLPDFTKSEEMAAHISRFSLEVLNLVLSGHGEHLIPDQLGVYANLPADRIADPKIIAQVLLRHRPPLVEGDLATIERDIAASIVYWRARALERLGERAPR